jgi:hypothetical protein
MGDLAQVESQFELSPGGLFLCRSGTGRNANVACSQRKLCFVATDRAFLATFLLDLSRQPDCYFVKYSTRPRDGMYLGRCFVLDDRRAGELWRQFKSHPKLMCTVQDDDFAKQFRRDGPPGE